MNETPTDRHHREWAEGLDQAAEDQRKLARGEAAIRRFTNSQEDKDAFREGQQAHGEATHIVAATTGLDVAREDDHTVYVRVERAPDMGEGVPAISGKVYRSDNLAPSKYRVHSTGEFEEATLEVDDPYLRKVPTIDLVRELRRRKVLKPVNGAAVANDHTYRAYKGDPSFIQSLWYDTLMRLAAFMADPQQRARFVEQKTEVLDERGDEMPPELAEKVPHRVYGHRLTARIEVLDLSLIGRGW